MKDDLDNFLERHLLIAAAMPDRIKSQFDKQDMCLMEALDITVAISKSSYCLESVLAGIDIGSLDEPRLRSVKKLRLIWRQIYELAQIGTDRIMSNNAAKLAA